jgi:hypothetical protein
MNKISSLPQNVQPICDTSVFESYNVAIESILFYHDGNTLDNHLAHLDHLEPRSALFAQICCLRTTFVVHPSPCFANHRSLVIGVQYPAPTVVIDWVLQSYVFC